MNGFTLRGTVARLPMRWVSKDTLIYYVTGITITLEAGSYLKLSCRCVCRSTLWSGCPFPSRGQHLFKTPGHLPCSVIRIHEISIIESNINAHLFLYV